ncbi:unnamed protein product, partial [Candidula unifasciata]
SKEQMAVAKFKRTMRTLALQFRISTLSSGTQRQLYKITNIGVLAEPDIKKVKKLFKIKNDMEAMYSKAKFCLNPKKCFPLSPEVLELNNLRLNFWNNWRNITGRKMKNNFKKYVKLSNAAVKVLGEWQQLSQCCKDLADHMIIAYEVNNLVPEVYHLMEKVGPLYRQLHAYVRHVLKKEYGAKLFPSTGQIPAHLLGNMWADRWDSLNYLVQPFKKKTELYFQRELTRQNYTVRKMLQTAEDFIVSLGLNKIFPSFWELSSLDPPKGEGKVMCLTTLMDFPKRKDLSSEPTKDFVTIHRQMGKMAYYMTRRDQPFIFRDDANEAFHEAVGGVIALSAQTPKHLKKLNLIQTVPTDEGKTWRYSPTSFWYIVDNWRWSVLNGTTAAKNYNKYWWQLRCEVQGVSQPIRRTKDDFDPGSTYDIAAGLQFMRTFLGTILQFQFYKVACQAANHQGPLHRCDIYGNAEAGEKLRSMMKLGSSEPWWKLMESLTGEKNIDPGPMMEYFKPLFEFLKKKTEKTSGGKRHVNNKIFLTF